MKDMNNTHCHTKIDKKKLMFQSIILQKNLTQKIKLKSL